VFVCSSLCLSVCLPQTPKKTAIKISTGSPSSPHDEDDNDSDDDQEEDDGDQDGHDGQQPHRVVARQVSCCGGKLLLCRLKQSKSSSVS